MNEIKYMELASRSIVLPEKLIVPQQVKKFYAFYGTRKYVTVFT
jgi:hypothetical protein